MHYAEAGQGEPILFIHGFPLDSRMWQSQVAALQKSHRVLVPDLPGFGETPLSAGTAKKTMADFARDLAGLLDQLKIGQVNLVGLSMGGYIAFAFWRQFPQRLKRLGLANTRAVADTPEAAKGRHDTAEKVRKDGLSVVEAAMLPKMFPPTAPADAVALTRQMILESSREGTIAALAGLAERPDVRGELGQIKVPTLVVAGELDPIAPAAEMKQIADAIPGSRYEMIAGAGHMTPLEKPAEFNRLLAAWLSS